MVKLSRKTSKKKKNLQYILDKIYKKLKEDIVTQKMLIIYLF